MEGLLAASDAAHDMRTLTEAYDWSRTPVGARADWSPALRTMVDAILASSHPMFIWWGPQLIQFYNDAYRHTMGPERHPSALGQAGRECWEEIWPIIGPQIESVLAGGPATWHEDQLVPMTRHGARRDVWWTYGYSALRDGDEIVGVLVVCTDVTAAHVARDEQRRLTAQLRAEAEQRRFESERQKLMFQQAPGFMCILRGPEHVFEFVNDAYRRLVGPRAVLGRPVLEVLPEVATQGFIAVLDEVYASASAYTAHAQAVQIRSSPCGPLARHFLDFVYQPIIESDGTVSGIFVQGSDITERYQAEEALRRANQRKDEFLATLAHELRNPLAPITAAAQLLRLTPGGDERTLQAGKVIERQARHMTALVDDLMDASRFSRGQEQILRDELDLGEALDAALEQARPLAEARGHCLVVRRGAGDLRLRGDRRRLVQAIVNLVANAAKYTPPGGRIEVELSEVGTVWAQSSLRVVVRDNGIGIAPEQQPRIFELFSQGAHSPEHALGGLGIGLALVQAIAGLHGGQVSVRSDGEGMGSEFTLVLPRRMAAEAMAVPAS